MTIRGLRIFAAITAAVVLAAGCSPDDPAEILAAAENAYFIGDYPRALTLFRILAGQGDLAAQMSLGFMYAEGAGVAGDFSEALMWFEMAADQGDVEGQYSVARAYDLGQGTGQDASSAAQWYTLAAEQGHAQAQATLAELYSAGRGIGQDDTQAYAWAAIAAEQGSRRRPRPATPLRHGSRRKPWIKPLPSPNNTGGLTWCRSCTELR